VSSVYLYAYVVDERSEDLCPLITQRRILDPFLLHVAYVEPAAKNYTVPSNG